MRVYLPASLFPLLLAATASAQMHKVAAPEKVTRSVGVYEWTGDLAKPTAARLIPVSLFIEAQYQDGGTYYARPVPLSLESGNIYSLEKAGVPQGTLTLDFARHLQSASGTDAAVDLGWFGYGTFALPAPERKSVPLRASASIPKISSTKGDDDDRPTLLRNGPVDSTDKSKSKDAKSKKSDPQASVTPVGDNADDPDRPHFSKKPGDGTTPATGTSTAGTSSTDGTTADSGRKSDTQAADPSIDPDRPTLKHRDAKQAEADRKRKGDTGSVTGMSGSLADDPDRPNMRHGKSAGIGGDPSPQLTGIPPGLHQIVAVSDPTNRETHPFARSWGSPAEQSEVTAKLAAMARTQLAIYNTANSAEHPAPAKPVSAKPVTKTAAHATAAPTATHRATTRSAAAAPALPLTEEQVSGFTLSYGGLPTFVYSASSAAPATAGPSTGERYVTLVAQLLPSGEMQLAFASVTDAQHLDRTPWYRLVDAVDPDAGHRASLLFELRAHNTRQFALYRILSAKAEELFVTHVND